MEPDKYFLAPPEKYSFLKIGLDFLAANFIGPLPKEGDKVEIVCTGVEHGKMHFQLKVVGPEGIKEEEGRLTR